MPKSATVFEAPAGPARVLHDEVMAAIAATQEAPSPAIAAEMTARAAAARAAAVEAGLATLKAAANAVKVEISGWKAWWDGLPPERAVAEIPKRQMEIARLAARLAALEAEIAVRVPQGVILGGVSAFLQARAEAIAAEGPAAGELALARLRAALDMSVPGTAVPAAPAVAAQHAPAASKPPRPARARRPAAAQKAVAAETPVPPPPDKPSGSRRSRKSQ